MICVDCREHERAYGSSRCMACLPVFAAAQRVRRTLVNRRYYETLTKEQRREYRMRNQARRGVRPYWFKPPVAG